MLKKLTNIQGITAALVLLASLIFFAAFSVQYSYADRDKFIVRDAVITIDGKNISGKLPFSKSNLPHGTEVTISFETPAQNGKHLFFGSVYAPLQIYANGEKIYEYGQNGTYPPFMHDPPTQYDSVILPDNEETVHIKMVYHSPNERDTLSVHEPIIGTSGAIFRHLLDKYGITLVWSLFFIIWGMALAIMSAAFRKTGNLGRALLFPGMFAMFAGMWQFGENTLSVYILQNPVFLYFVDFLGLFLLMIPLYATAIFYLNKKGNILLESVLFIIEMADIAAVILQITGIKSFHSILFVFHILLPSAMILLFGFSLYEVIRYKSGKAAVCI